MNGLYIVQEYAQYFVELVQYFIMYTVLYNRNIINTLYFRVSIVFMSSLLSFVQK